MLLLTVCRHTRYGEIQRRHERVSFVAANLQISIHMYINSFVFSEIEGILQIQFHSSQIGVAMCEMVMIYRDVISVLKSWS